MTSLSKEAEEFLSHRKPNGKQKDFFDQHAKEWDIINHNDARKLEYIADLLSLGGGEKILDVGTGTGVMIPYYLERLSAGRIVAVDFSEKMIEQASAKYPPSDRLEYMVSDVNSLPPSESFDTAVCYSCFPHFPDPRSALKALAGTLKHGGKLVIAHSSSKDFINNVHRCSGEEISNDYLPNAEIMSELFGEQNITTIFSRDDGEYYIVMGIRE